jgi:hypothetical protein
VPARGAPRIGPWITASIACPFEKRASFAERPVFKEVKRYWGFIEATIRVQRVVVLWNDFLLLPRQTSRGQT